MKRSFKEWTSSVIDHIKIDEEARREKIERLIEENDEAVIAEAVRFENKLDEMKKGEAE